MQLKDLAESQNAASSIGEIRVEVAENGTDNSNSDYDEEEVPKQTFTKISSLFDSTTAKQDPLTRSEQVVLTKTKVLSFVGSQNIPQTEMTFGDLSES